MSQLYNVAYNDKRNGEDTIVKLKAKGGAPSAWKHDTGFSHAGPAIQHPKT